MRFLWAKGLQDEMNITLAFVWKCDKNYIDAKLSICATHAYRIWKNGDFVGYGPARAAHGYTREDKYSFGNLSINDVIVIEVCAYNVRCLSIAGTNPFFGAEIKVSEKVVAQSENFCCYRLNDRKQKVLRYSFQRAFTESYETGCCRSLLYCGKEINYPEMQTEEVAAPVILPRNVPYPTYDETVVATTVERGIISVKKEYKVWRDRAHQITDIFDGFPLSTLEEDVSEEFCKYSFSPVKNNDKRVFSNGEYGVFSFTRTLSGFFKLRLTVEEDCVIYIAYDEIDSRTISENSAGIDVDFKRNDTCNIIKYTLKCGEYNLMNFEPYSVRFTRFCVTEGRVNLQKFTFVSYENPQALKKSFVISDKKLSDIVFAAQNTLAQNSVDILMDCPSRERAGWINDAFFSGRAEYVLTGFEKAHYNLIENYALESDFKYLPKGMMPMCFPGDFPNNDFIPQNAMWFVLNLYEYNKRMCDERLINISKEKVYGALKYFSSFENEFELLEDLKGWRFIEWSAANRKDFVSGVNFPSNMLYFKMLRYAGEMYGDSKLIEKSERVRKKILELSYNGELFTDNAERNDKGELIRTNHTTETCQYYAFFFGVADKNDYDDLYNKLKKHFGCFRKTGCYPDVYPSNAIIGFLLRLDLLRQDKDYDKLLKEVKKYYAYMAKATGTLWEHKDIRSSLNHCIASYVAVFVLEAFDLIKNKI